VPVVCRNFLFYIDEHFYSGIVDENLAVRYPGIKRRMINYSATNRFRDSRVKFKSSIHWLLTSIQRRSFTKQNDNTHLYYLLNISHVHRTSIGLYCFVSVSCYDTAPRMIVPPTVRPSPPSYRQWLLGELSGVHIFFRHSDLMGLTLASSPRYSVADCSVSHCFSYSRKSVNMDGSKLASW